MRQKEELYLELTVGLKNLGATTHKVQQEGSYCKVFGITVDLREIPIRILTVFPLEDRIEPGESISDLLLCKTGMESDPILWIRIDLRVTSGSVEWRQSKLLRVERADRAQDLDREE